MSKSSWEYPKYIVLDKINGIQYKVVSATVNKFCLESLEKGKNGEIEKKAVDKSDPNNRYKVLGYYD